MIRAGLLAVLVIGCSQPAPTDRPAQPLTNTVVAPSDASVTRLALTSADPARGDVQGGTYVILKGQRFLKDGPRHVKVYFGSRQGVIVRFQSDSELIVQAPGGKPGEVVDVLVIFDPGGQLKLPAAFTFVDSQSAPTVDDLTP